MTLFPGWMWKRHSYLVNREGTWRWGWEWSKKIQDRIIRNSMHVFKSSSQCKSTLMRLILPDTYERVPVVQRNTKHHKNLQASCSLLLIVHIKQRQLLVVLNYTSTSRQTSDFAIVPNQNGDEPATTEGTNLPQWRMKSEVSWEVPSRKYTVKSMNIFFFSSHKYKFVSLFK